MALERLCGIPVFANERQSDPLFANWPRVVCTEPFGHESDHRFDRGDGVEFHWPVTPADVETLRDRSADSILGVST